LREELALLAAAAREVARPGADVAARRAVEPPAADAAANSGARRAGQRSRQTRNPRSS
jgi:hypothetical protein